MKVLYISPYPPAPDGIGHYTSVLAAAMRDRGCNSRVLIPRPAADSPAEVLGAIGWLPGRALRLRRQISEFGPDVVHVQFAVPAFGVRTLVLARWISALKKDLHVPVLVTMHEVTRDTARLPGIGRMLYRSIARSCDTAIVHTQAARAVLIHSLSIAAQHVTVIAHPAARPPAGDVKPDELRERFGAGDARILLAFGFVHVDKGLQDLVRALAGLRRAKVAALDEVRVVIAGAVRRRTGLFRVFEARDHLHLRRVLRMASRHGVRDRLILTGYVPGSEVAAWFQAAEAVVLPYRRTEQSGVAGLAISLGIPVLASRVGGLEEQFSGSPWTFPARDPAALTHVLADFLTTPTDTAGQTWQVQVAVDLPAVAAATLAAYAGAERGSDERLAHVS